ncbi:MAG: response regulator [Nitrospinaceae bacterium]
MNHDISILIVEDLFTTRLFMRRTLKSLGFQNVVLADDGKSALDEIKSKRFDLIVSDWNMPRMSGLDFFRALKKDRAYKDVPFLLVSSETEKAKVLEARKAGISHYMIKPVKPEILESKIKEVFAEA